jgi:hypothetical protein
LNLDEPRSKDIESRVLSGDLSVRPGWVRVSIHPTMLDEEVDYLVKAIQELTGHAEEWSEDYRYNKKTNEFDYTGPDVTMYDKQMKEWFQVT